MTALVKDKIKVGARARARARAKVRIQSSCGGCSGVDEALV